MKGHYNIGILGILILLSLLFCQFSEVNCSPETVTVVPFGHMIRTVTLKEGDTLIGTLSPTTLSAEKTTVGSLKVLTPDQATIVDLPVADDKQVDFSFTAHFSGDYTISFWSKNLLNPTKVTLDYNVQPEFIQSTSNLVIASIVAVIIVVCIGLVSIRHLKHKKQLFKK